MTDILAPYKAAYPELNEAQYRIMYWRDHPVQYVNDVFDAEPDPWQAEALGALAEHDKVSIRSGHGVGKSTLDSWAILWFLSCFFPAKVPCAAPTLHQLKDILWSELTYWHGRMPRQLKDQFGISNSDQNMQVYLKSSPQASFAVARTGRADNPEALQGFHSENLMFVLDEASGIADPVFEVAQGALSTPGSKVIMTANPTRTSGYFYDSHNKMRNRWHCIRVSCEDSPRVSKQYIEDVAQQFGSESNVFRVRVQGEFPDTEDDVLIPLHLIESALEREVEPSEFVKPIWGLDVARFGNDDSALAKRQGNVQLEPVKHWHGNDVMETVGRVVQEWENTDTWERPAEICVDVIGIGSGVVDRLRELGLPVKAVNVAEKAYNPRYMRLRDELWWRTKEFFEQRNCKICDDQLLISELTDVKYKIESSGKTKVESKDDMKKRVGKSPDVADAWVLTFAGAIQTMPREEQKVDRYRRKIKRKVTSWLAA